MTHSTRVRRVRESAAPVMATIALLLIVPNRNAFAQSAARPIPPAAAAITSDGWDTLSADITIRRVHVNQDGSPAGDAPETVQLHWERTQVAGGWRTTTTVVAASRRMARGPDGRDVPIPQKLTGTRVVDEADGSKLRVYDANGKELTAGRWNVAAALGGDPAAEATAASRPTTRAPIVGASGRMPSSRGRRHATGGSARSNCATASRRRESTGAISTSACKGTPRPKSWSIRRRRSRSKRTSRAAPISSRIRHFDTRQSRDPACCGRDPHRARQRRRPRAQCRRDRIRERARGKAAVAMSSKLRVLLLAIATIGPGPWLSAASAQDRPTIFLHGLKSDPSTWQEAAARLSQRLAIEPHRPATDWRAEYPDQARQILNNPEIAPLPANTVAVGHSNGGVVARQLSRSRPLGGIVTIGTPHYGAAAAFNLPRWNAALFGVIDFQAGLHQDIHDAELFFGIFIDILDILNAVHNFTVRSLVDVGAQIGLDLGVPVLRQMIPGSTFLQGPELGREPEPGGRRDSEPRRRRQLLPEQLLRRSVPGDSTGVRRCDIGRSRCRVGGAQCRRGRIMALRSVRPGCGHRVYHCRQVRAALRFSPGLRVSLVRGDQLELEFVLPAGDRRRRPVLCPGIPGGAEHLLADGPGAYAGNHQSRHDREAVRRIERLRADPAARQLSRLALVERLLVPVERRQRNPPGGRSGRLHLVDDDNGVVALGVGVGHGPRQRRAIPRRRPEHRRGPAIGRGNRQRRDRDDCAERDHGRGVRAIARRRQLGRAGGGRHERCSSLEWKQLFVDGPELDRLAERSARYREWERRRPRQRRADTRFAEKNRNGHDRRSIVSRHAKADGVADGAEKNHRLRRRWKIRRRVLPSAGRNLVDRQERHGPRLFVCLGSRRDGDSRPR